METLIIKSKNIKDIEKLLAFAKGLDLTMSLNNKPVNLNESIKNFYLKNGTPQKFLTIEETNLFLKNLK